MSKIDITLSEAQEEELFKNLEEKQKELENLVDSFIAETAKGTITEEKVGVFYDKLLTTLEAQGYLTKQDLTNIKGDPDYPANVKQITQLITSQTPDLKGTDKMCYKVARQKKLYPKA